ncbi:MAG TPA: LuxR C-terminal-related transcriptional regulator, partial [Gemmatimonadaceae bacterium]|nr:LuxR C-terminal-related transcriptional regulator [Gemmatimonadaceae bacterium]
DTRLALAGPILANGWRVELYTSASAFLDGHAPGRPGCLVAGAHLPDMSALELLVRLQGSGATLPSVVIARHGTIPMSVQAMKLGAVDFLTKPVREADLLTAIAVALARDDAVRREQLHLSILRGRFHRLTPRECEVYLLLVHGLLNKQIASQLGNTEQTVKVHRRRIMQKMEARSFAQLVLFADRLMGGSALALDTLGDVTWPDASPPSSGFDGRGSSPASSTRTSPAAPPPA